MKTVLITGTSKGLGLELATCFLSSGWTVLGISRQTVTNRNNNYSHLSADITSSSYPSSLNNFLKHQHVKTIDIVINNAGTGSYGSHLSNLNVEEVSRQINLHCIGALCTVQQTRQYLKQSKIVNITSRLGSATFNARGDFKNKQFSYSYRVAKAAQNMLSLCLSDDEELAGNQILSIIPGLLRTDSGSSDAELSAKEGAEAIFELILSTSNNGIYHAFKEEAAY